MIRVANIGVIATPKRDSGVACHAERESCWDKKLNPGYAKKVSWSASAELFSSAGFEVISWLAAVGTIISVVLTAAYPAFDPAALFLGQFP